MNERILHIINTFCNGKKIRFSKEIGTSPASVSDWVNGNQTPSKAVQNYICDKYGVNLLWLQTGQGEMLNPAAEVKGAIKAMAVPVLARIPCGFPLEVPENFILDYVYLPNVAKDHYIVQASGDSMLPAIRDGDYALIRPQSSADNNDVVVARDPWGAFTIKRARRIADDKIVLVSDNGLYAVMEPDEWVIIGKVVKVISVRNI